MDKDLSPGIDGDDRPTQAVVELPGIFSATEGSYHGPLSS